MIPLTDKQVRERAVSRGVEALTDVELLSLLLPVAGGEESIHVAQRLLDSAGSLAALTHKPLRELRQAEGLGIDRAIRLAAAAEVGRRALLYENEEKKSITSCDDVVEMFSPLLATKDHEEMWVLYLSSSNRIIEKRQIALGGNSQLIADCKLILRRALNLVASGLIVVHNHPSGTAAPSHEDEIFTQKLKSAAELLDVRLLDHIIIARGGGVYSFRGHSAI